MNSDNKSILYLAYIDVNDMYKLLDSHNILYGNWTIKPTQPIKTDYTAISCIAPLSNFDSYIYHTQFISYESMINIINKLYECSTKADLTKNIPNLYNLIKYLSRIFENIYHHINF